MANDRKSEENVVDNGTPTIDNVVVITAATMSKYVLLMGYYTDTTSGGATGKNNIHVVYEKTPLTVMHALAQQEIKRKIAPLCRTNNGVNGTVERIKAATHENPAEFKVNELVAGTIVQIQIDPMEQLKSDISSGKRTKASIQEELAELLKSLPDDKE